eukprot:TRINITY_DN5307_c0_g2_i2.p1 TRINITY_DN5307_c0_g2~~TRINITY_DN5307_c0_g2_i2.p1  ORF type:complete len:246 (-),score=11.02 TRINITY_DN5307_c0_g2_i2:468-1205(-)
MCIRDSDYIEAIEPIMERMLRVVISIEGNSISLTELPNDLTVKHELYNIIKSHKEESSKYRNPLHACCLLGREEIFNLFKECNPDINSEGIDYIKAALHAGSEGIAISLINMGVKADEEKLLMESCYRELESLAIFLIKRMQSVNVSELQEALSIACSKKIQNAAYMMVRKGAGMFVLIALDVNNLTHEGKSPLICACESRSLVIVRMLLKNGADPNLSSRYDPLLTPIIAGVASVSNKNDCRAM